MNIRSISINHHVFEQLNSWFTIKSRGFWWISGSHISHHLLFTIHGSMDLGPWKIHEVYGFHQLVKPVVRTWRVSSRACQIPRGHPRSLPAAPIPGALSFEQIFAADLMFKIACWPLVTVAYCWWLAIIDHHWPPTVAGLVIYDYRWSLTVKPSWMSHNVLVIVTGFSTSGSMNDRHMLQQNMKHQISH